MPTAPSGLSMESKPGEILIAGMRMCLLDVATSLFRLRKSLEAVIGPAVATIFYDAGLQGALKYTDSIVSKELIRADEAGFREALTEYSDGGFGRFEIASIDFPAGQAAITCTDPASAEGHAFIANRDRRKQPRCDFSRGVLVGLFSGIRGRTGLAAFEESCRAAGDDACLFRIGAKDAIERLSIEQSSARRHRGATRS